MKILLTLIILLTSTTAQAKVKRGVFTSTGGYVMDYQKNDYKSPRDPRGYQPYRPYNPNRGY